MHRLISRPLSRPLHLAMMIAISIPAVGCKKVSTADSAAYDYGAATPEETAMDGVAYGGGASETSVAMPAPEPTIDSEADDAPRMKSSARRRGGLFSRREGGAQAVVAAPPAVASPGAAPTAGTQAAAADPAEPAIAEDEDAQADRHIVYTATMHVSVFNLVDAMEVAEALPEKYGGYIASMTEGSLVLRIPSKNLRKLMSEVGDLGVVEHRSLQAQDVTDEYFDIEARITALEKTHAQLLDLLGKARTVQEALEVRRSLDQIAMELEVLKGRMRKLENLISYSTLTLGLVERGPFTPTPSSNDPFPWVDSLGVEATEWK
jgi:hypothetical protein